MGGNAFVAMLQPTAFPRLPPTVYHALRSRIQSLLAELYMHVGVPYEAPQKPNHGDLDLIVCLPRRPTVQIQQSLESKIGEDTSQDSKIPIHVPHEIVATTIKARHVNPLDGNRTSNFALPILKGEWAVFGQSERDAEFKARKDAGGEDIFYQVDVNVCESKEEWDRRIFHHGYGDLNIILGLIVKNSGLHYSDKGLKYPDPPNPPIVLSESFDEIVEFFGWSMDEWKAGFQTNLDCYKWAVRTKYFNPSTLLSRSPGIRKKKSERTMYAGFIEWVSTLSQGTLSEDYAGNIPDAREAALDFFNKRSELNERRTAQQFKALKNVFSGVKVRGWTNLGNYWLGVKKIMDGVREELGGDDGVAKFLNDEGEEKLKSVVLDVQAKLGVWARNTHTS